MTSDQVTSDDTIYIHEQEAIQSLRSRGFAVIVWTPGELDSAAPKRVEDRSVEVGWEIIEALKD
jgi:hypothetical protein